MANCIWQKQWQDMMMAMIVLAILLPAPLGAGDKKLISIMPLFIGADTQLMMFYLSIIYLGYFFTKRKGQSRPFAPAILGALLLTYGTKLML